MCVFVCVLAITQDFSVIADAGRGAGKQATPSFLTSPDKSALEGVHRESENMLTSPNFKLQCYCWDKKSFYCYFDNFSEISFLLETSSNTFIPFQLLSSFFPEIAHHSHLFLSSKMGMLKTFV